MSERHWGQLTGVRPGKLALKMKDAGLSDGEIRHRLREDYRLADEAVELLLEVAERQQRCLEGRLLSDGFHLYVSLPFCPSICHYCSFPSLSLAAGERWLEPVVAAIGEEIAMVAEWQRQTGRLLTTVYVGGGTPSAMPRRLLASIMDMLRCQLVWTGDGEFTVEAGRPDTVDGDFCRLCRQYSVSRVCVNPQTLNDQVRRDCGRGHSTVDFFRAVEQLRRDTGCWINVDLIAGLPGETVAGFASGVQKVIELTPENITIHVLCRKRGSRWQQQPDRQWLPAEVDQALADSRDWLRRAGYRPYYLYRQKKTAGDRENVGYCLPGRLSVYNVVMINEQQDIIGLGPGAASKIVAGGRVSTIYHNKSPAHYLASFTSRCRMTMSLMHAAAAVENHPGRG
ncbi:MAG: coproporphyrinogen dehydrogenase HemZ [Negativicutes bacterium]|nr:coproporphyrinogen dehydrogenase HemZ [Negativicutes bacterium]